jgi:hypothetical protein
MCAANYQERLQYSLYFHYYWRPRGETHSTILGGEWTQTDTGNTSRTATTWFPSTHQVVDMNCEHHIIFSLIAKFNSPADFIPVPEVKEIAGG